MDFDSLKFILRILFFKFGDILLDIMIDVMTICQLVFL